MIGRFMFGQLQLFYHHPGLTAFGLLFLNFMHKPAIYPLFEGLQVDKFILQPNFTVFMKLRLLLSPILFFIFIGAASAQMAPGAFYLGGSVGYNYNSYGSESTITYLQGYTNYYLTKLANL